MATAKLARPPAWTPMLLAAAALLIPGPAAAQNAEPIATPERAPPGFREADIAAPIARWPFTDPAFAAATPAAADGAAERRLRELVAAIAGDPRYAPSIVPPEIAEGALDRPPPDTTLWPEAVAADLFPAPSAPGVAARWSTGSRAWILRHEGNARAIAPLRAAIAAATGDGTAAYVSRSNTGGQAARARTLIGARSDVLGAALDAAFAGAAEPDEAGREAAARMAMAAAAGETESDGVFSPAPVSTADDYLVEIETPPWELRLALAAAISRMRGTAMVADAPVAFDAAAAAALAGTGFAYDGFALAGVGVTQFGASAGPRGVYEASALLAFRDEAGRRALASLVLRFEVADDQVLVEDAEVVALAPEMPFATVWFVPVDDFADADLRSLDGPGLARLAARRAVDPATAPPTLREYYVIGFVADRVMPDAAVELRIATDRDSVGGYPGGPAVLNFDGWQARVHRVTLGLGAPPEIVFKVVYRAGAGLAGDGGTPILLRAAATAAAAPAAVAQEFTPPGGARARRNLADGGG